MAEPVTLTIAALVVAAKAWFAAHGIHIAGYVLFGIVKAVLFGNKEAALKKGAEAGVEGEVLEKFIEFLSSLI
jgi:hypothetical protein